MMKYQIGQVLEASIDQRALFTDGAPRWHGLTVPPQHEAKAEAWLKVRGVYSFHPVTHRTVTIRGKKIRRESRYLPGYVFARFPGEAIWHRVLETPFITDAIRLFSGHPAFLKPKDLVDLHDMRSRDEAAEAKARHARTIHAGDRVRLTGILSGIVPGDDVEVLTITNGRAKVRITMFGGEVDAEVSVSDLRKAHPLAE